MKIHEYLIFQFILRIFLRVLVAFFSSVFIFLFVFHFCLVYVYKQPVLLEKHKAMAGASGYNAGFDSRGQYEIKLVEPAGEGEGPKIFTNAAWWFESICRYTFLFFRPFI